jgi:glycosyltransferase involved in cell wall biosynthesis
LERVEIIPGVGVDLARFTPSPVPVERPFRAVYLGRAVRSKGLLDLAAVATRPDVREAGVEVHLYCAIDSTSPGTLDPAEIERIGTTPGIVLHPHTDDPAAAIAGGHVAVLASHGGEGVSKFLMESLAVGRPVVASRSAGTDALVEEDVTGWTFTAGNTDDLARVLMAAAACPQEHLARMGKAGRALVEERFDLRLIAEQIVALHRRLAAPARR